MKTAYEFSKEIIQKVRPQFSYQGKDLLTWQAAAREKLMGLMGLDKFSKVDADLDIEYEKKTDGATELRFTYATEEGYRVPCHLFLPDGVENPPVIITLQGHSKGMHISMARPKYNEDVEDIRSGDRDFCVRALKEGFAAIAMEQRNFGECGGDEKGPHCFESSMTALLMGRTTAGERVWDIMRLIDLLEESFADRVDTSCICCMGNSGGGTATAYVAALEDRIKLAMPSCAMSTYKDSIGAMHHCACNYIPGIANLFDMGDLLAMSYPKYYVQVNGTEDTIFPIEGAESVFAHGRSAYEEMGEGDRVCHVKGAGGHRFYADDSWPIVHRMLGR